ncbi:MAG: two-component system response regulator GlrR [Desulfobacterales bacterium C00003060]|nr:MAG: two-component system response regulator GlrR [Desulfobacterales bacterium S3730MH5]OEU76876.1 MAG: two-component system response regulator GlrR [Desulfobacterales bacterium C00003060]OEU78105.1 MAG: two-component system response regulator GlrR [Desulfobacterales bacterium S5133MH4]
MAGENILVVDDDKNMLEVLRFRLEAEGYNVSTTTNAKNALSMAKDELFDLALIDLKLAVTGKDGIELMQDLNPISPEMPVIILTAHGTIETAVDAMKQGAYSYLTKPYDRQDLLLQIRKGLEKSSLSREIRRLKALVGERYGFENIVSKSKKMQEVMEQVSRSAETESNVCIYGESGTGKELIAKSLHLLSSRKNKPFVAINCAAIPEGLLEGELFGHEKGAFTNALRQKRGFFAQANGGSILLDEISEMSESMQVKLLRILQEKQFYPLGGERPITVDVRIISATNKNLEDEVKKGNFREDLFYRVHVIPIYLSPLRERKEDIPLLVDHFITKFAKRMKKGISGISTPALQKLLSHSWPGNVRELRNTIEYAVAMTTHDVLDEDVILQAKPIEKDQLKPLKETKNEFERDYISNVLSLTGGNVSKAARLAGKHRPDFYDLLKKHNLKPTDFRNPNKRMK